MITKTDICGDNWENGERTCATDSSSSDDCKNIKLSFCMAELRACIMATISSRVSQHETSPPDKQLSAAQPRQTAS